MIDITLRCGAAESCSLLRIVGTLNLSGFYSEKVFYFDSCVLDTCAFQSQEFAHLPLQVKPLLRPSRPRIATFTMEISSLPDSMLVSPMDVESA